MYIFLLRLVQRTQCNAILLVPGVLLFGSRRKKFKNAVTAAVIWLSGCQGYSHTITRSLPLFGDRCSPVVKASSDVSVGSILHGGRV